MTYILSLIATILGFLEPFGKKMRTILLFNLAGNLLVGVNYILTHSRSGALICAVACGQVIINYFFDVKNKKVPIGLVIFYAVAFLLVNITPNIAWYDVFSLLAAMLFVVSVAQSDAKYYRILYASNSAMWILYDFFSHSYANFATHAVLFIGTFAAMLIRDRKKKEETEK